MYKVQQTGKIAFVALVVMASGGCGILGGLGLPPELADRTQSSQFGGTLPGELTYLMEHKTDFAASGAPVNDVTPGTVKEDLGGLTGCWGAFITEDEFQGAAPAVEIFEAYHFDAATGRAQRWVYTSDVLVFPAVYAVDEGPYQVVAPGVIEFNPATYSIYDLSTGQGRTVTDPPAGYFEGQKYITLSGDWISVTDKSEDDTAPDVSVTEYYRRFECP